MRPLLLLLAMVQFPAISAANEPPESFLRQLSETDRFMSGRPVAPRPTGQGQSVLFLRAQPRSKVQSLFAFDVATGKSSELLSPEALLKGAAEKLSAEEKARL